jgi:uncharacterized protein DUF4154
MGFLRAVLQLVILSSSAAALAGAAEPIAAPDEYQVKAAYMIGFSRFVEIPDKDASDIVLCSAGDERMVEALKHVVAGKASANQHVLVRSIDKRDSIRGCTVLFISSKKIALLDETRKCAPNVRLLTVGDYPGFLEAGGAIEFVWAGKKIQFNANLSAIQCGGLKVSSRMLNLARNLRGDSDGAVQ